MIPADQLGTPFSILHDGEIQSCSQKAGHLALEVGIRYLAQQIAPHFSKFTVEIDRFSDPTFTTWPLNADTPAQVIVSERQIFGPKLKILEGSASDGRIEVICNQPDPAYGYCGGELRFGASSARVRDEAGRSYGLEELQEIATRYWDEWSAKTKG